MLTCGVAMAQVMSGNITGVHKAREITGKVMVANTYEPALTFTESALAVKLHNVFFDYSLPNPSLKGTVPKYILPQSITLDGIDIDGQPLRLSTKTFSGPCIHVSDSDLVDEPMIIYFTVPDGTNAPKCSLLLTDTHFKALAQRRNVAEKARVREQEGGGSSPPAARPSKPTP
jgi:hypothetical protein